MSNYVDPIPPHLQHPIPSKFKIQDLTLPHFLIMELTSTNESHGTAIGKYLTYSMQNANIW